MRAPAWYAVSIADRLLARRTIVGDCWEWTGCRVNGYGRVKWKDAPEHLVPRLAWTTWQGPIPEGMCVLHTCDNPPCFNPDHLFLGSRGDNSTDMIAKGRARHPKGLSGPPRKLTPEQIREIRAASRTNGSGHALALRFGVSDALISLIRAGKR